MEKYTKNILTSMKNEIKIDIKNTRKLIKKAKQDKKDRINALKAQQNINEMFLRELNMKPTYVLSIQFEDTKGQITYVSKESRDRYELEIFKTKFINILKRTHKNIKCGITKTLTPQNKR